jgi:hypothetical protein
MSRREIVGRGKADDAGADNGDFSVIDLHARASLEHKS